MHSIPPNTILELSPRKGLKIIRGPSGKANAGPQDGFGYLNVMGGLSYYDAIMFWAYPFVFIVFAGWLFANAKTNVGKRLLGIPYAGLHVSLPGLFLAHFTVQYSRLYLWVCL